MCAPAGRVPAVAEHGGGKLRGRGQHGAERSGALRQIGRRALWQPGGQVRGRDGFRWARGAVRFPPAPAGHAAARTSGTVRAGGQGRAAGFGGRRRGSIAPQPIKPGTTQLNFGNLQVWAQGLGCVV